MSLRFPTTDVKGGHDDNAMMSTLIHVAILHMMAMSMLMIMMTTDEMLG